MNKTFCLKNIHKTQSGFTLMEVMIAISIFAVFASVFVTSFGYNMLDSGKLKENILLKDLAENKINDIITNPPVLSDQLTLSKEIKDIQGYDGYQTIVEYKKFFVPDMNKIKSGPGADGEDGAEKDGNNEEDKQQNQMEKRIFSVFKENMEKMIWQVEVTVKNKSTDETLRLTAWLYNQNADVKIGTF